MEQEDEDDEEDEEDEEERRRRRRRTRQEEEEATDIKSNNPHLAGGEKIKRRVCWGFHRSLFLSNPGTNLVITCYITVTFASVV